MSPMTPPGIGSERPALPDPLPLIGRAPELAALEALMEGDAPGPKVLFLRGEGGVGKSRLVAELAERAHRRSWSVAHGRAFPFEAGTPYAVFGDAWLPVLKALDASTLTVLSRGGEAELSMLFPALGPGDVVPDPSSTEPGEFRTRLMWNFAEFVNRYAARRPVLCILEDMHWADSSSLELMHFLARQATRRSVVIVCTYNDQQRDRRQELVQAEHSLASMGLAGVLRVEPLSRDQVAELVSRSFSLDSEAVREFSAALYDWTRGNPFFVEEIVKSLVASGRVHAAAGTWVGWEATDFAMPRSIREAILGRIQRLSPEARYIATMAAVVGGRVSYPLLELISELDGTTTLGAAEELCARSVLDESVEDGVVFYDFRHPLVRQTLYDEIGLQRARMHHAAVARAIEAHYGAYAEDHADELAFHFARTDGRATRGKARRYLVAAGRRALERRADAEAIDYLEAALERTAIERSVTTGAAIGGTDDPAAHDHDAARADEEEAATAAQRILPLLARAHTHMGHFDTAARLWSQALQSIPPDTPEYADAARVLGLTNVWRGRHSEAEQYFALGLEAAETAGDERTTVRTLVAKAHGLHEIGRGSEALEILEGALPIADRLGDGSLLASVHRALSLLRVWVGPPERAIEHGERAIALARSSGDLAVEFWARWGLAVLAGMRGDTTALAAAIDEVNALADRLRSPVLRLWTADLSVELAHATGDWDHGIAIGERAIETSRALSQRTLLPRLLVWTSQFYVARNDLARASELVDEAVRVAGIGDPSHELDVHQVVPTYIGLAQYRLALGEYREAIEAAERGLAIAEGTGYVLWAMHQLLPLLAEACLWAGQLDRAEEVGRRMREHATRIDHRLGLAWADACDSLVQWKRGDAEGAVTRMKTSADELERIPMLWAATRLRRQVAGRLFELDRSEEGRRELDRVHDVCMQLKAGLELEKTRAMYRENGLRPPLVPGGDGPLGLTPAERAVALHTSRGMSNRSIAQALGCSVRTVSTHLSNIYGKLDIGGAGARVRLGNLVREAGLTE